MSGLAAVAPAAEGAVAIARIEFVRPAGLAAAAALALLLHALLLGGVDIGPGGPAAAAEPPVPPAVQVRSVTLPAALPAVAPEPAAPTEPAPPPSPRRVPTVPAPAPEPGGPAAAPPSAAPAAAPLAEPAASQAIPEVAEAERAPPAEPAASAPFEPVPMALAAAASAATAAPPGSEAPPVYSATLPPAVTLDYELRRGMLTGTGTLSWRPDGARYELQLDGSVVGLRVLTQVSRGRIDARGLAPERFTDQRARRAMQAANFRRDVGRISFSGPTFELPLHPGVQDRLSWMVQLPGIVAADPARRAAGQRIVLQVVGARGDTASWTIEVIGTETLATRSGPVPALHLRREPRGPYDTRVEVWLDPARQYLPLRATQQSGDEDTFELRLR